MLELLTKDTSLWILFSFLIFAWIVYYFGGTLIIGNLDKKIDEIKREIKEAENLRVEAQELLAQYQRKYRDAEKEAEAIISSAHNHADKIRNKAEADLVDLMSRKEEQLTQRLKRIEENAITEIQNHAADLAVTASQRIISETINDNIDKSLRANTLKSLKG